MQFYERNNERARSAAKKIFLIAADLVDLILKQL